MGNMQSKALEKNHVPVFEAHMCVLILGVLAACFLLSSVPLTYLTSKTFWEWVSGILIGWTHIRKG